MQKWLREPDEGGGIVSEESFLPYRLEVVKKMPDGPFKAAVMSGIAARLEALRRSRL
jgi:hypothetical protein